MAIDPIITESYFKPITNAATGRVAFQVKADDGTTKTVECGSTGLRDLSGMFPAGAVTSGRVLVERAGNTVTWYFQAVNLPAGATAAHTILENNTLLSPFMPQYQSQVATMSNGTEIARLVVGAAGTVRIDYGEAGYTYTGVVTFTARNNGAGWPTTLPGVADGQPVAV